jgi:hypothetical protein
MVHVAPLKLPPPRPAPAIAKADVQAGLRAFFAIMKTWGVEPETARVLLGSPPRSTFFAWKAGRGSAFSVDLVTRLSTVLGIFKALEILYQNPAHADRWVSQPNLAFGGQSALQRMASGQITDLAAVRDYLDHVRGAR